MPHRIRLQGFWTTTRLEHGRYQHQRAFGKPRLQHEQETHWLLAEGLPGPGTVSLNGVPIGDISAEGVLQLEVTGQLLPRNQLRLEYASDQPPGLLVLEIRAPGE